MPKENQVLDPHELFEELKDSMDVERIKSTLEGLKAQLEVGGLNNDEITLKFFLEGRLKKITNC